ncbi:MAG: hypothetical protein EHM42_14080 [Planctomycetaceae bacterium]|nr:MAG: hypothetical protein EHM42_14080 [Planctomycetaceae bacterium]
MNRFALLAVGLFACLSTTGCYHCCQKHQGCVDWQGGCCPEPGCVPLPRGARLQHHRPRVDCDDGFEELSDTCADCGRHYHRRDRLDAVCDDCGRYGRRDAREARRDARRDSRLARRDARRGRLCDRCGGACTGACGYEMGILPCGDCGMCGSCCGGEVGYPAGVIGAPMMGSPAMGSPMMGSPMMGEGMMMPSGGGGGCASCASGGMSSGSYMGTPTYQGTVMSGQIVNPAQIGGSNGWVSSPSSSYVPSEPTPAPGAGAETNFMPTGSTAPSPGTFPTPAR